VGVRLVSRKAPTLNLTSNHDAAKQERTVKTFATEIEKSDGSYDGPILTAQTWQEAEAIASGYGAKVASEFGFEADVFGNVLLIGTAILGESAPTSILGQFEAGV
jgi:hypothetical protein